jgi:hypothetical protein
MFGQVRTGVDHRDLAAADDLGPRPPEGEWARVARDDAADPRSDRLEPAVLERELTAERYLPGHDSKTTRDGLAAPRASSWNLEDGPPNRTFHRSFSRADRRSRAARAALTQVNHSRKKSIIPLLNMNFPVRTWGGDNPKE